MSTLAAMLAVISTSTSGVGNGTIIITMATSTRVAIVRSPRRDATTSARVRVSIKIMIDHGARENRETSGGPRSGARTPTGHGPSTGRVRDGRNRSFGGAARSPRSSGSAHRQPEMNGRGFARYRHYRGQGEPR